MKQTIQIKQEVKDKFEVLRFKLKREKERLITQNEFLGILLNTYKEKITLKKLKGGNEHEKWKNLKK